MNCVSKWLLLRYFFVGTANTPMHMGGCKVHSIYSMQIYKLYGILSVIMGKLKGQVCQSGLLLMNKMMGKAIYAIELRDIGCNQRHHRRIHELNGLSLQMHNMM